MKTMIPIMLAAFVFAVLGASITSAQTAPSLPQTSTFLPDSPLYFLQRGFIEPLQVAFAFDHASKAATHLQIAERRLAEIDYMKNRGDAATVSNLASDAAVEIAAADTEKSQVTDMTKRAEIENHAADATSKHIAVLQGLLTQVPPQAQPAIQRAIGNYQISKNQSRINEAVIIDIEDKIAKAPQGCFSNTRPDVEACGKRAILKPVTDNASGCVTGFQCMILPIQPMPQIPEVPSIPGGTPTPTPTPAPTPSPTPAPTPPSTLPPSSSICAQIVVAALNTATFECKSFSTPCDVPSGWKIVPSCGTSAPSYPVPIKQPAPGYGGVYG